MCPLHSALTILKETPFKDDTSLLKRVLGVTYGLLVAKNQNPKDHDLKLNLNHILVFIFQTHNKTGPIISDIITDREDVPQKSRLGRIRALGPRALQVVCGRHADCKMTLDTHGRQNLFHDAERTMIAWACAGYRGWLNS